MNSPARSLAYDEALAAVLEQTAGRRTAVEVIPLEDALGRALAHDVTSRIALPPWDNAGMDGFAARRADIIGARTETPRSMPVVGTSVAGSDPTQLPWVQPGTLVRIMTGAPMPPGADVVIRVEDSRPAPEGGDTQVLIVDDRDTAGRGNVRPRGEDIEAGRVLFHAGTMLRASHLGALASIGSATVATYRAPRVTVVSSGDELVLLDRFDEVETGSRIVASSSYALPALLAAAGAQVTVAPLVPDRLDALTEALRDAVTGGCDLLVTTGGVSVGDHDYTRDALNAIGGVQRFWRARIRPGGPIGTGMVGNVPWIGLPGNPVSTMVTATLFAWPLIRQLGGHDRVRHLRIPVRMCDNVDTPAALTYFLRVSLSEGSDGLLEARLSGGQGSNLLRSMALADALLVVPESLSHVSAGSEMQAILLPDAPPLVSQLATSRVS